jgi:hypothetical protein
MRNPTHEAQGVLESLGRSFVTVVNPPADLQNVNEKMRENDKLGFWRQMRIVANKRLRRSAGNNFPFPLTPNLCRSSAGQPGKVT